MRLHKYSDLFGKGKTKILPKQHIAKKGDIMDLGYVLNKSEERGHKNEINYWISNSDPLNSYTYRFFGSNTGLPTVDNNTSTNVSAIKLAGTSSNFGESDSPGTLDPVNGTIYYSETAGTNVHILSTTTNTLFVNVFSGSSPRTPAYDSIHQRMYVPNSDDDSVSIIDTNSANTTYHTVIGTVSVGSQPRAAIFDPVSGNVYILNRLDNTVSVISTASNTVIATVAVGTHPLGAVLDTTNNRVYVCNNDGASVSVISTASNTVIATVAVGTKPSTPLFNATQGVVYIFNLTTQTVSVISITTNTVVATITIGSSLFGGTYSSSNSTLYVSDRTNNRVRIIDCATNLITGNIAVSTAPLSGSIDTINGLLMIPTFGTGFGIGTLVAISLTTNLIISTINLTGAGDTNPVYYSGNQTTYVMNSNVAIDAVSALNYVYTPVTIIVNGNATTVSQANSDIARSPICVSELKVDTSTQLNIANPIAKKYSSAAGLFKNIPVTLLSKRSSFETVGLNIATLKTDDFADCLLDGMRYIEHVIAPSSTVNMTLKYDQLRKMPEFDYDGNFIYKSEEGKKKVKKYIGV